MANTTPDTQLRGHCQRCGRLQAVRGGMAHHGYTVADGYFAGKCSGHEYRPLEIDRKQTDALVVVVAEDAVRLKQRAADLRSGAAVLASAIVRRLVDGKRIDVVVPFAELDVYAQRTETESAAWSAQRRGEMAESFCRDMTALADRVHGQPLVEVKRAEAPAAIVIGEQRVYTRTDGSLVVFTAYSVHGAVVHYTYKRNEEKFRARMATRSWRALVSVVKSEA
jgi:hypothetical protein